MEMQSSASEGDSIHIKVCAANLASDLSRSLGISSVHNRCPGTSWPIYDLFVGHASKDIDTIAMKSGNCNNAANTTASGPHSAWRSTQR